MNSFFSIHANKIFEFKTADEVILKKIIGVKLLTEQFVRAN